MRTASCISRAFRLARIVIAGLLLLALTFIVFMFRADALHLLDPESEHAVEAAEKAGDEPNLSFSVPEEELGIWDPINPKINPVPWYVHLPEAGEGQPSSMLRHMAIGKRVQAEGIAWGYDTSEPPFPKSQLIFDGGTVLVKGADFTAKETKGKTVRVVGTLRLHPPTMRPGIYRPTPKFYYIDAESVELVSAVSEPHVTVRSEPLERKARGSRLSSPAHRKCRLQ